MADAADEHASAIELGGDGGGGRRSGRSLWTDRVDREEQAATADVADHGERRSEQREPLTQVFPDRPCARLQVP